MGVFMFDNGSIVKRFGVNSSVREKAGQQEAQTTEPPSLGEGSYVTGHFRRKKGHDRSL